MMLLTLLTSFLEQEEQSLILVYRNRLLTSIGEKLNERGIGFEEITRHTPTTERIQIIERFQAGTTKTLISTMQQMGVGLNLTSASVVFIMEPSDKPHFKARLPLGMSVIKFFKNLEFVLEFCVRAVRIGQTRQVKIFNFIADAPVELNIALRKQNKRFFSKLMMEDEPENVIPMEEKSLDTCPDYLKVTNRTAKFESILVQGNLNDASWNKKLEKFEAKIDHTVEPGAITEPPVAIPEAPVAIPEAPVAIPEAPGADPEAASAFEQEV